MSLCLTRGQVDRAGQFSARSTSILPASRPMCSLFFNAEAEAFECSSSWMADSSKRFLIGSHQCRHGTTFIPFGSKAPVAPSFMPSLHFFGQVGAFAYAGGPRT